MERILPLHVSEDREFALLPRFEDSLPIINIQIGKDKTNKQPMGKLNLKAKYGEENTELIE